MIDSEAERAPTVASLIADLQAYPPEAAVTRATVHIRNGIVRGQINIDTSRSSEPK